MEEFLGSGVTIDLGGDLLNPTPIGVVLAGIWILGGWAVRWAIGRVADSEWGENNNQVQVVRFFIPPILWFISSFGALATAGVNVSILGQLYSVIGFALGFGAREAVGQFLSGSILISGKVLQTGDVIEFPGLEGTVRGRVVKLQTMSTILETREGNEIVIPNSLLRENVVRNFRKTPDALTARCSVEGSSDVNQAIEIIRETCDNFRYRSPDKPAIVGIGEFGGNGIYIDAIVYVSDVQFATIHKMRLLQDIYNDVRRHNEGAGRTVISLGETSNISLIPPTALDQNVISVAV